ncbi:hypothetical protein NPIL_690191 [Nephila pilipes]|uniref:Uncharacterized protein n=1 Tax=Nephila pilipes TaxID=299642 RepID=A0A8X6I609_NEPPI|nr:hypothetical protein NPIL_690191 [Nephila pilipes]
MMKRRLPSSRRWRHLMEGVGGKRTPYGVLPASAKWLRRDGFPLKSYRPVQRQRLVRFSFRKILPVSERGTHDTLREPAIAYDMRRSCRSCRLIEGAIVPQLV